MKVGDVASTFKNLGSTSGSCSANDRIGVPAVWPKKPFRFPDEGMGAEFTRLSLSDRILLERLLKRLLR